MTTREWAPWPDDIDIVVSLEMYRMCENGLLMSMLSKVIVITVCECMHLIRRGHFWSHHWIRRTRKPHATRKPDGSIFYRAGVVGDRKLRCGNRDCQPFCSCDLDLDSLLPQFISRRQGVALAVCKFVLPSDKVQFYHLLLFLFLSVTQNKTHWHWSKLNIQSKRWHFDSSSIGTTF